MTSLQLSPVYPITDVRRPPGWSLARLVESFFEGGARLVQVREKGRPDRPLLRELEEVLEVAHRHGGQVVINDRVDLALAARAHGVHLGQEDLPVAVARRLLGKEAIIGLSTHDEEQFLAAQKEDVDYVALGPIFPTTSKADASPVVGLEELARLARRSSHPVVAIGGITLERAPLVWRAGAAAVAVISDIVLAADPAAQVRRYLERAERGNLAV